MVKESQRLCHMSDVEHLKATRIGDQGTNHDVDVMQLHLDVRGNKKNR